MSADDLATAAAAVRRGGVVAFPTETFYGLGADPRQPAALLEVLRLKGRIVNKPRIKPASKPLLLLVASLDQVTPWVGAIPPGFDRLVAHFWPGPLTLVLPAAPGVPEPLIGRGGGVAIRLTSQPLAQRFIRACGTAITGTSANPTGRPAPRRAAQVRAFFGSELAAVLDGGTTAGGEPSTLLQLDNDGARLLRAGAVGDVALREVVRLV